jgi:hypothetical protein
MRRISDLKRVSVIALADSRMVLVPRSFREGSIQKLKGDVAVNICRQSLTFLSLNLFLAGKDGNQSV